MAYSEERVRLVFDADAKRAKAAMQDLQKQLDSLMNSNSSLDLSERFTKEVKESQAAIAQLKVSLNNAFNVNTGKLDLSRFQESMKQSGMSLQKYQQILANLGPAGDRAFSQLALSVVKSEIPLKRSNKLLSEMWTTMKNTARWQLSASMLQGFTGAIQKAYNYAQDLNESLNNIRIVTNASVEDMARFAVEANKSAKALSTTTTEYTNASLIYYQQGLSAAEVKERTDVTIKMANVARESAETISDQMTAVWNNFDNGSKSLEYYADVMTALGAATASSTAEITTGLEKFAAVAETVGLSYEYATTALATITDTTRQSADVVGNALKTLFARIQGLSLGETLEDGTDLTKYSEALMKVGISIKEQDGSLKDMDTILDEMANKWGTLAKDQQVALAQTVAGVRQYTQLVALMDNWDKFQKNLSVAQGAEGALQEQSDIYAESWEAARDRVKAAAESIYDSLLNDEFFIDLTNGFAKVLGGVETLSKTLGGLPGILTIVGVAFNRIFNKQLISGINNIAYSLSMFSPKKQQEVRNEKINGVKALSKQAVDRGTDAGAIAGDAYKAQSKTLEKYLAIEEKITEEERKQIELRIESQSQNVERLADLSREVDLLEARNEEIFASVKAQAIQKANASDDPKDYLKRVDNYDQHARSMLALSKAQAKISIEPLVDEKQIKRVKKRILSVLDGIDAKELSTFSNEAQQAFEDLRIAAEKPKPDLQELKGAIANVSSVLQQEADEAESCLLQLGVDTERLIETFDEGVTNTRNLKESIRQLGEQAEHTSGQTKILDKDIKKLGKGQPLDLGTKINYLADSLGAVAMLGTSITGIFETWKNFGDEDFDFLGALLSTVTTLSFVAPMAFNSVDKLYKLLLNNNMADFAKDAQAAGGMLNFLKNGAGGATAKLMSLLGSAAPLLIVLAALTPIIIALVKGFKELKEQSPEGKLEKASETAKQLASALSEAEAKASELKSTLEGYESARKALDECVKGTDEWNEALATANAEALKLLELYPELYSNGGVKRNADGLIEIDTSKVDTSVDTNLRLASAYANQEKRTAQNNVTKANITKDLDDIRFGGMGPKITEAIFNLAKEKNGAFTRDELMLAIRKDAGGDKLSSDQLDKVMNLQPALAEWVQAINANTLATEIENETIASEELKDKGYDDSIIEAIGVSYNGIIDKAKADIKATALGDDVEDYFKQYAEAQGIKDASDYNASKGTYKYKDENGEEQEGELTYDALLSWAAATTTDLASIADKLNSTIGDNYGLKTLTTEGVAGLSLKQQQDIAKNNQEELANLVDMGVITQEVVNQLNQASSKIGEELDLEETLSANLQQTFKQAFGENWANTDAGKLIAKIPESMRDRFGQAVAQTNWEDVDSAQGFQELLNELGVWLPEEAVAQFVEEMMDANNATKNFSLSKFREEYNETNEILADLREGKAIDSEKFDKLGEEYEKYFTLMEDGSYILTGDAEEFYELVRNSNIEDLKESISARASNIADYTNAGFNQKINWNNLSDERATEMGNALGIEEKDPEKLKVALQAEYQAYQDLLKAQQDEQAALAATAKTEQDLLKLEKEELITTEQRQKALTGLNKQLTEAQKSLNGVAKGIGKSAPEMQEALDILTMDGENVDEVALTGAIEGVIKAFPELTGTVMESYNALIAATPGTQEYATAWRNLQEVLSNKMTAEVLQDTGKTIAESLEIIEDEEASATEIADAINQINFVLGTDFTPDDIGTDAFADLQAVLDGDINALDRLRQKMAEKYGISLTADSYVNFENLMKGLITVTELGNEATEALIRSGMFKIVKTKIRVPDYSKAKKGSGKASMMTQQQLDGMDTHDGKYIHDPNSSDYEKAIGEWDTKEIEIDLIKPVDDKVVIENLNTGSKDGGTKSSKSKYEPKQAPKKDYDYEDRQTEDLQKKLDKETEKRERAIGKAKQQAYEDEEKALNNLYNHYATFKQQLESDLEDIKNDLTSSYGAVFDKNGLLTNYNQVMEAMYAEYNKRMAAAHGNDEATHQVELWWEEVSKLIEKYDEVNDRIIECSDNMEDLDLTKLSDQLEKIQDQVDDVALVADNAMKYLDYQLSQLENKEYAFAEKLVALGGKVNPIAANATASLSALNILLANGIDSAEELDAAKAYADNLYSSLGDMDTLWEDIGNTGVEAISYMNEELDSQMDRLNTLISILGHAKDIAGLLGETFLEDEDATQAEIDATTVEVNQDKLASTKADLEFQRKTAEEARKQMGQFAEGSKEYEYWKKIAEDADKAVEQHEEQLVSDLKTTLESIDTEFENSVQRAIKTAEEGVTAYKSIAEAQKELDWIEQGKDLFLEPFEKAHELSKLTRSINGSMNDLTSSTAKKNLAGLLDMIKEHEESGKEMSEYDLQILQKKYELELARADLEASKNAKSQVRLTRDDEGNWSYQYTADQEKIDEATQNFEDKMFEIKKLSRDHIDETTGTILDLEAQMFEELAGLRREDYASQEEYDAAKKAIEDKYLPRINSLYEQVGGAIEEINGLYKTEVLTFGESTTGVITGASSQEGAMNQLKVAVETASGQMSLAWNDAFKKMKDALTTAGVQFDGDSKIISDTYLKRIGDKSDEVAGKFQGLMDKFTKDLPGILTGVSASFTTLGSYFDTLKGKIEAALNAFNSAATTFTGVDLNNTDTWTVEDPEVEDDDTDDDVIPEVPTTPVMPPSTTKTISVGKEINAGSAPIYDYAGSPLAEHQYFDEDPIYTVLKESKDKNWIQVRHHSLSKGITGWFKKSDVTALNTGGYTGVWGPEGRLALLHQKELVLNSQDTENFLAGINILREITKAIDLQATAMSSPSAFNMPFATSGNGTLEQNVHISASFPGVQDRNEIEFALRNLVNDASQFIMMR